MTRCGEFPCPQTSPQITRTRLSIGGGIEQIVNYFAAGAGAVQWRTAAERSDPYLGPELFVTFFKPTKVSMNVSKRHMTRTGTSSVFLPAKDGNDAACWLGRGGSWPGPQGARRTLDPARPALGRLLEAARRSFVTPPMPRSRELRQSGPTTEPQRKAGKAK